jgi:hypothetical protein
MRLTEAVGSEEGGHLEDAEVVVALGELGGGGIVDDEGDFGMELEGGGRDGGSDGAFDGFGDGGGFGIAGGEEQDLAGFEDGADAHGDGAAGAFFARSKKLGVVVYSFLVEDFQAGARAKAGRGFVEADVAIAADAKKLQVDAAGLADGVLIGFAVVVVVAADGAIGDVDVVGIDVDVCKEIFLHEVMEALRMRGGEAEVFIEIESDDAGEIERAGFVEADEFQVDGDHGAAGGQAESEGRLAAHGAGDELRGLAADFGGVTFEDDQHAGRSPEVRFDYVRKRIVREKKIMRVTGTGE